MMMLMMDGLSILLAISVACVAGQSWVPRHWVEGGVAGEVLFRLVSSLLFCSGMKRGFL